MQGLNTRGAIVTQGLNPRWDTFAVVPIFPVPLVGEWFVRKDQNSPFIGPFSYRDADRNARFYSVEEGGAGLAQVVTLLGNRKGDPVTFPARVFVDGYYARGKKFLGGRAAQFHSDNELLIEAPDFGYKLHGFRNK